ncbi:MAG: peptidoglycan-binding protein LysM [Roseitalea sp.]|jgi:nucleoid-associated protein YgaU|uniref:peptidoglycan-binding protein LysM n=1 Tax=Oceaniradius stylonematis TaxID=2184161 RepID=UPI001B2A9F47|nr:peptidoglycan-binding protein LysM [Oceaniradius stylonematis]MBO6553810.1 peptidoglycan-binding protein LysM [Roseitalea sp.]MBO6953066.1 peptidoglycan-binding protein LysM [Rhizobiaceae bacterium]MBO6593413.1 peptidoglycan-binding protein LysM [Roseitalea sp.]MBO6600597.1 peptidoglycan-binding protein LysM [Roseitalea sp.]MBO6612278.1 peptidoglycan-binding protein LysM [Roseitalea sp.]
MGFFDFVKSAGKRLGFGDDDEANAEELKRELDSHGLGTDAVQVEVKGDTAVIRGAVEDQSIFEKAVVAVGNTLGISKVEASELKVVPPESGLKLDADADMNAIIAAATPAAEPKFHTVEKGDTLWAISEKAYGNGSKYELIFEANKPMLTHPDKIYPGQVLRIPDIAEA